jgi:DNA-binding NarL/FixJ family response regulator
MATQWGARTIELAVYTGNPALARAIASSLAGASDIRLRSPERTVPGNACVDVALVGADVLTADKNFVQNLRERFTNLRVLMVLLAHALTTAPTGSWAGAAGVVALPDPQLPLCDAVRLCARGWNFYHPSVAEGVTAALAVSTSADVPESGLTAREHDVLCAMACGLSNRKIAERLALSEKTVKNHVSSILLKLGVDDRTHAVVTALRAGWVTL